MNSYRYGFNGMERDNEIAGTYTAEYWQYDGRLGRRWNVDPITYPWQSSYAAFNNNPVYFIDPLGLQGTGPGDILEKIKSFVDKVKMFINTRGGKQFGSLRKNMRVKDANVDGGTGIMAALTRIAESAKKFLTNPGLHGALGRIQDLARILDTGIDWGSGMASFTGDGQDPDNPPSTSNGSGERPSFSSLQENYPGDKYTSAQVYEMIGGKVYQNYLNNPITYANSCALMVSYALNKSGAPIPYIRGQTGSGNDGSWYFYRVADLSNYLNNTYGVPDIHGTDKNSFKGHQGIIQFDVSGWSDATGHFTIWNGNTVGSGDYFDKSNGIHLWSFP